MSNRRDITRRDFLSGVALGLAAGTSLTPLELLAATNQSARYYPPGLTGLRGSHPGSFEAAHAVAMGGVRFKTPKQQTDSDYDLIVVGGGISGLAAAFFWQQRHGDGQEILILENHDDFGGHAKRNEFDVDGRRLISYGGSEALENPSRYSGVSKRLLIDLGIDLDQFFEHFDQEFAERFKLGPGIHFTSDVYGRDVIARNAFSLWEPLPGNEAVAAIERYPLSDASKADLRRLLDDEEDHLADLELDAKLRHMLTTSYSDYLRDAIGVTEEVIGMLRDLTLDDQDAGWDATSVEAAWWNDMPGTAGLDLGDYAEDEFFDEDPYIHHFPDGNASVARALIARLIPKAVSDPEPDSLERIFNTEVDYDRLDSQDQETRLRLNSTAVDVRHSVGNSTVEVTYVNAGQPARVRSKHVVLACYNSVIPHICPDLGGEQRDALHYAEKIPMVYTSIAVRQWRYLTELGVGGVYVPNAPLAHGIYGDYPVNMGNYRFARGPDEPVALRAVCMMREPDKGLTAREQHVAGRRRLLEMSFDDHERLLVRQLDQAFGAAGFDAERDITAITVNRWPHGYAYEYNTLFDPLDYHAGNGPHIIGRARVGRISIANSDSTTIAYVDASIDAADRAVTEQMSEANAPRA